MIDSQKIINNKLEDLLKEISKNGFEVFTSSKPDFCDKKPSSAIFPDFFILDSLNSLKSYPAGADLISRLTSFLKTQAGDQMSFNYWRRDSNETKNIPYPDDLDSTSMAFASMDLLNGDNDGEALAYLVMMLGSEEAKEGGPYYTWIAPSDAGKWKDVDLAVNANVAYALGKVEAELPSLTELMESAIEKKEFVSRYYEGQFSVAYFISRAYKGERKKDLKIWFEENIDRAGNSLDLSFCILGLIDCGVNPERILPYVAEIVNWLESGSEDIYPFVVETNRSGNKTYSGSHALQISLALQIINVLSQDDDNEPHDSRLSDLLSEVKSVVDCDLADYENLRISFYERFERIAKKKDKSEIILVAAIITTGLSPEDRGKISDDFLVSLGVISLCGWIAYSIYDDFLDNEGNPFDLPIANYCLKKIMSELKTSADGDFYDLSLDILNRMDVANVWELKNARLPCERKGMRYEDVYDNLDVLADRSMGHALGSILILSKLGYSSGSIEASAIFDFFKNYIIARQLNDDLRDCFEDLKAGNISPAVAMLLEIVAENGIDPDNEVEINKIIWNGVLPFICRKSLEYSGKATEAAGKISHLGNVSTVLLKILDPVRIATEKTLSDQKTYLQFTKTCG